jgi:hypothetical protein
MLSLWIDDVSFDAWSCSSAALRARRVWRRFSAFGLWGGGGGMSSGTKIGITGCATFSSAAIMSSVTPRNSVSDEAAVCDLIVTMGRIGLVKYMYRLK